MIHIKKKKKVFKKNVEKKKINSHSNGVNKIPKAGEIRWWSLTAQSQMDVIIIRL